MPEDATGRLDSEYIDSISPYLSATSANGSGYYLNEKIPYRFNYGSNNNDTGMPNGEYSFHGTHVAGIAAGNGAAETDKEYNAKGIASNAQLVLMSSYNFEYHTLMAAYDDCTFIGVDVVNASYGASYTSSKMVPFTLDAINNMIETGMMFCAAAGNDSKILYPGKDSLLNVDYSTGGFPNDILSAFTVGSVDNLVHESNIITVGDNNYEMLLAQSLTTCPFGDSEMEFEIVPGLGYPEDFKGIDVKNKIAVIQRGEIEFDEKAQNAKDNGAVGVIFYNNVNEELIDVECLTLPSMMISLEDGQEIISSEIKTVKFYSQSQLIMKGKI